MKYYSSGIKIGMLILIILTKLDEKIFGVISWDI